MPKLTFKTFLIFALILFSGAVAWNTYLSTYLAEDTVDIHLFPKTINDWTSEEIPISEGDYAILETRNAFVRNYRNTQGEEVMLFIIYSENNRKVSHPPELCYTGGGITIVDKSVKPLQFDDNTTLMATKLDMDQKGLRQHAYYWFKVGDTYTHSYWTQQFLIATKSLLGQNASSALIRVSSVLDTKNPAMATESITTFTQLIKPLLLKYLP